MKREILYIPNLLSILRILLVLPAGYFLIYQRDNITVISAILLLMFASDLLDGYIARKFNQVSELGIIIDPIADKAAVAVIAIILFLQGRIETWFFIVIVARDLLILAFGLYLKNRKKIVLMSNFPGKAAVFSIGIILLLTIINAEKSELLSTLISYLYYISVIIIIYSLIIYLNRFHKSTGEYNNAKR